MLLAPEVEPRSGLDLRLLHAGPFHEGENARDEIARTRSTTEVGEGVLMPVGSTVGALWDRRAKRYVAISRPFEVAARRTVEIPLERPVGVAHVVAQVLRHEVAGTVGEYRMELSLSSGATVLPPALKIPTADKVYAFWYDLGPGTWQLRAEDRGSVLPAPTLELEPGTVERFLGELRSPPALNGSTDAPR